MLELFRREAIKRGLIPDDSRLNAEAVFSLVRDMPYERANSRDAATTIREWRGTCSGKHYLLNDLFHELGFESRLFMATHTFTEQNTQHFPEHLRGLLSDGPVPDVHTFLRIKSPDESGEWVDVDATWPIQTKCLGMRVNERFQPHANMALACEPIEIFEVPAQTEPQEFKKQLIDSHCGSQDGQRDQFIEEMSKWLQQSTAQF